MTTFTYWLLRVKLTLMTLFNPWGTIKTLKAENKRLVETITDPLLTGLQIGNGSLDISMEGAAPKLMAGMFLGMFEKYPDAKNYIEVTLGSPQGPILVTVQKPGGKSPDTLRREAEQEVAALRAEVQGLKSGISATAPVVLQPMSFDDGRRGWYVHHPQFYCDIEQDQEGKLSVFFRDRATGSEAFGECDAAALPA